MNRETEAAGCHTRLCKGDRTRQKILTCARQLFAQKGFLAVTMADVCERSGLSRGGVYRYFSGTEELFAALLEDSSEETARLGLSGCPSERLSERLRRSAVEIGRGEDSLSLAIYEYAAQGHAEFFERLYRQSRESWSALIREGMACGEFRQLEAESVVDMILFYYQGLRLWSRVMPLEAGADQRYAAMIQQLLLGGERKEDTCQATENE